MRAMGSGNGKPGNGSLCSSNRAHHRLEVTATSCCRFPGGEERASPPFGSAVSTRGGAPRGSLPGPLRITHRPLPEPSGVAQSDLDRAAGIVARNPEPEGELVLAREGAAGRAFEGDALERQRQLQLAEDLAPLAVGA